MESPNIEPIAYWMAFSKIPYIGSQRVIQLYNHFGDLREAWGAAAGDLKAAGLNETAVRSILNQRDKIDLETDLHQVRRLGVEVITIADDIYPPYLRRIDDPPAVLYLRGTLVEQDQVAVAVVGTREPTNYGRNIARLFSEGLARQGVTVISGLALGIDANAHIGALDAPDGRTIGVLGSGIDIIYPPVMRDIAKQMVERGAILSEFPIGTKPVRGNFPRRNRILSGMTLATLIVEAPEESGALITARLAAEQGRDVFVIPGNISHPASRGSNRLIQDGAQLVQGVDEILEALKITYDQHAAIRAPLVDLQAAMAELNAEEKRVLEALTGQPQHVDHLLAKLPEMTIDQLNSILFVLEVNELVESSSQSHYRRC